MTQVLESDIFFYDEETLLSLDKQNKQFFIQKFIIMNI